MVQLVVGAVSDICWSDLLCQQASWDYIHKTVRNIDEVMYEYFNWNIP